MAQKRISMKKIREVLRCYFECNLSIRKTAKAVSVSRKTVSNYVESITDSGFCYNDIKNASDDLLLEIIANENIKTPKNSRYIELSKWFNYITTELKRTGVTLDLLWLEYKEEHPDGFSYSHFCYHYRTYIKSQKLSMHIEHKAGDKMFVDFTGHTMPITCPVTMKQRQAQIFIALLGCSQYTFVYATESQKKEDWIRANNEALTFFNGVPSAIVPDNLKSAVKKANYYEPDINPDFQSFSEHYNTVILPARPKKPKDKALVEGAVKIIYTRIFAPLRNCIFYSLDELNTAIRELLEKHNNLNFQKLQLSRKKLYEEVEKKVLKPLPSQPFEIKQYQKALISFNYHVWLKQDNHYYSVPYQLRQRVKKQYADIYYTDRVVEIYHNNIRVAFYKRNRAPGKYTTRKEHMPSSHRFYAEWNPERFKRWAKVKGEYVEKVIERNLEIKKHPEQSFRICLGIINLGKKYSNTRLNKACKRAMAFDCYSYIKIRNILEKNLEGQEDELPLLKTIPEHKNVRGKLYYK